MLELRNITKKYNNIAVVKRVSFTVKPGEILGYLGPNGAGKSTTVKMLAGLLEPSSGSIHMNGIRVDTDAVEYKKRIGYLPEHGEIYPYLSGGEYLELVGRLRRIPEALLQEKIYGFMDILEMGVDMHLPMASYSKGMKQKVLVAAALLHDPEILLLDEPLSGLDVTTTMIFKDVLSRLAEMGKIIIYSSHILEVVEKVCSRVIIIDKGEIAADDSVAHLSDLLALPSLDSIFRKLVRQKDTGAVARDMISYMQVHA